MTPRQQARAICKPLFERPVTPEQIQVCDAITLALENAAELVADLKSELNRAWDESDNLRLELSKWKPKTEPVVLGPDETHF